MDSKGLLKIELRIKKSYGEFRNQNVSSSKNKK